MKTNTMTTGEKIRILRSQARMSQDDLASHLPISRQSVSKWELNEATPDVDSLVKISEVFGVTVDFLVKEDAPISRAADLAERDERKLGKNGEFGEKSGVSEQGENNANPPPHENFSTATVPTTPQFAQTADCVPRQSKLLRAIANILMIIGILGIAFSVVMMFAPFHVVGLRLDILQWSASAVFTGFLLIRLPKSIVKIRTNPKTNEYYAVFVCLIITLFVSVYAVLGFIFGEWHNVWLFVAPIWAIADDFIRFSRKTKRAV